MNIEIPTNLSESAAAEIQAIIDREAKEQGEAFVPKDGEKYWFVNLYERGTDDWYEWESDDIDKAHFIAGNCFPTEEAAHAAEAAYLAKSDAQYAIALWLAEHQDWLSTDEEKIDSTVHKYYVKYDRFRNTREIENWGYIEPLGVTSFRKREYADQFIEDCGEHLRVVHGLPKEEGK
jgi:hypothetical protein